MVAGKCRDKTCQGSCLKRKAIMKRMFSLCPNFQSANGIFRSLGISKLKKKIQKKPGEIRRLLFSRLQTPQTNVVDCQLNSMLSSVVLLIMAIKLELKHL